MLKDNFEIVSEFNKEKVLRILKGGISNKFRLFPDKIMQGQIIENKFKSVINPPLGFVDIIKSRVKGEIEIKNDLTTLKVRINPSWGVIGFLIVWVLLILLMIITYEYVSFYDIFKYLIINLIWLAFPFVLALLKLKWDSKRLKKWMTQNLK